MSLTVLDSTQMSGPERLGELGSRQLAWLRDEFGSLGTDQRLQVVIMHHDPATRLLNAGAFRAAVPDQGLIMHGWGPSASATALASTYASAPAVPDPAAGYLAYKIVGQQVAIRGQQVLPAPASGSVSASSIFLTSRPASESTAASSGKAVVVSRNAPLLPAFSNLAVSPPVQER